MKISRREALRLSGLAGALAWLRPGSLTARTTAWPDDPFLKGAYAPTSEEHTLENLKVVGKLPAGLEGLYLRNGPNPQFPPPGRYHWFDGDGMLHGVRIAGGKVSYRNRWIRTAGWQAEHAAKKGLYAGLGDPPGTSQPPEGGPQHKNPANTSIIQHHGKVLALWEGGTAHAVSAADLSTEGAYDFGGALQHPMCAHPKIDPDTGMMHLFGYAIRPEPPYLFYSRIDKAGRLRGTQPIVDLPRPVMMHDFALTERYVVFLDLPYTFSFDRLRSGRPPFAFESQFPARLGVMPRDGGPVKWFADEACWIFHLLNAWEVGDELHLHGCRYPRFPGSFDAGGGASDDAYLHRWRLDLKTGKVARDQVAAPAVEMPRIDERRTGRAIEQGYFMAGDRRSIVRIHTGTGQVSQHRLPEGVLTDEPVFAPAPGKSGETEGWVLCLTLNEKTQQSALRVIDAQAFDQGPVAEVQLGVRVPFGLHGAWLA